MFESRFGQRVVDREELRFADLLVYGPEFAPRGAPSESRIDMTTKLAGDATFFLPFNMGNGEGVTAGAGNPTFEDKYSVSYMWEDILTKDTILDLISKFIFVEVKEKVDDRTGKVKRSENLIFPRYHQLDVIRKVLADVRVNRTAQNYLIQHIAGSGKTNSIAWLAHRLSSLHDSDRKSTRLNSSHEIPSRMPSSA